MHSKMHSTLETFYLNRTTDMCLSKFFKNNSNALQLKKFKKSENKYKGQVTTHIFVKVTFFTWSSKYRFIMFMCFVH